MLSNIDDIEDFNEVDLDSLGEDEVDVTFNANGSLTDKSMEEIRLMHHMRGGIYNWQEIVDLLDLDIAAEALRKRIQRYEKRIRNQEASGVIDGILQNPERILKMSNNERNDLVKETIEFLDENYGMNFYDTFDDFSVYSDKMPVVTEDEEKKELLLRIRFLQNLIKNMKKSDYDEDNMYRPYPKHLDDTELWENWKKSIAKDRLRVVILSDFHFPDHSVSAIRLALKLVKAANPDVVIFNGDLFDFDALSTFAKSRRRRTKDALAEVASLWKKLVDNITLIAPNAKQIAYRGNHDSRIDRWNDLNGNPFADTTDEAFVNMVRSNNRVWWLGQYQETHIGPLFVQHGKRSGENAAKGALKDQGWAMSVAQGHNHQPQSFVHRVAKSGKDSYHVVSSVSMGALCNIPPAYQLDTRQSRWLHGIAVATIFMEDSEVDLQNIIFHQKSNNHLWTAFGSQIFESDN